MSHKGLGMEKKKVITYHDLEVYKKAIQYAKVVYSITENFPDKEKFGLISQSRRAVVSISANIAEGWGRDSSKNYTQFLKISRGSLYELDTLLTIALELYYINHDDWKSLFVSNEEISKMLNSLIRKIENNPKINNS